MAKLKEERAKVLVFDERRRSAIDEERTALWRRSEELSAAAGDVDVVYPDVGSEEHQRASDRRLLAGGRHVQRRLAVPIRHVE